MGKVVVGTDNEGGECVPGVEIEIDRRPAGRRWPAVFGPVRRRLESVGIHDEFDLERRLGIPVHHRANQL